MSATGPDPDAAARPVAIITGGARGMGAATGLRLVAAGWRVALLDLAAPSSETGATDLPGPYLPATTTDLDAAVEECGPDAEGHAVDVRDSAALTGVVDGIAARLGRVDALVAAAGAVAGGPPTWETDDAVWHAMLDVNLTGVFHLARAGVPHLLERPEPRRGRFVAVASSASHHGLPSLAAYSAAKHGVAGLVKALAAELGPTGVTANAVAPGSTMTGMLHASAAIYGLSEPGSFARQTRIRRAIDPDEIAGTVAWLCTEAPGALTGAVLDVDGGFRP
jgi:SDR family mycofactocin-dependent oxidoreductase